MIDVQFIHRLEGAILSILKGSGVEGDIETHSQRVIKSKELSKRIAQELYFNMDVPLLLDLVTYKMSEAH